MPFATNDTGRPDSDGSALCLACGLCCQGVLHRSASLQPNEKEFAVSLGLELYPKNPDRTPDQCADQPQGFSLPCPLHQDGQCSVYPTRPHVCGAYRCELLKKYLNGTSSLEKCLEVVRDAKALVNSIRRRVSVDGAPGFLWTEVTTFLARQGGDRESERSRRAHGKLLLDEQHLALLCRHFETPRDSAEAAPMSPQPAESARRVTDAELPLQPSAHVQVDVRQHQVVIRRAEGSDYSALEGGAADMWSALTTCKTIDAVIRSLMETYDVEEQALRNDVNRFVENLRAHDLVDSDAVA